MQNDMEEKLTEETIELVKEYLAKETEGLITEFTNLLDDREKLKDEFNKQEDHESFKYRTMWKDCWDRVESYNKWLRTRGDLIKDDKKEIKPKEFEHDSFWSKESDIERTSPLILNDMYNYDFRIKDLWQRSYSKIEFQKAISYIQKYIDLYKEGIAARKEFIAKNYYSTFVQELKGLVLFYERSVKVTKYEEIKETTTERQWKEIFDELHELIREKKKLCDEYCDVVSNLTFEPGRTWLECRNSIKETIGLSSMAEKEDRYLPIMDNRKLGIYLFDEEYWGKRPEIVKVIEHQFNKIIYPLEYPKEDLLVAKKYMEQNLNDLKASIALAKECISSNYYGNFMKDLEVLVRKY